MHPVLVLVRKDFTNFFRNRAAVVLTFVVPFALIYIFGQVFGATNQDGGGPTGIPLAVVNASDDSAAVRLVEALQAEPTFSVRTTFAPENASAPGDAPERPLTEEDLQPLMQENSFRFALVIPSDFLSDQRLGVRLKLFIDPRNEIEAQVVKGILQRTIFSEVPQLLGRSLQARGRQFVGAPQMDQFNGDLTRAIAGTFGGNPDDIRRQIQSGDFFGGGAPASSDNAAGPDFLQQLVQLETEQVAGRDVKSPAATRIVGGFAIQFLLFAMSASAAALFYERDQGIFQRLLAGPARRSHILWSKFVYGVLLGLIQIAVLFIGGRLLYGIEVENHLGPLLVVSIFAAGACTAFGMLIASLVKTPEAASSLGTFIILLMCAVGGAWFPVSFMPEAIQTFSRLTLVYWAIEGFTLVLWADASLAQLAPSLAVLGGITTAVLAIAMWRFNRGNIFD